MFQPISRSTAVALSTCLALFACDGAQSTDADVDAATLADSASPTDTSSAVDSAPIPSVSMRLVPFDFFSNAPLEGVEICVPEVLPDGGPGCETTTVEGAIFLVRRNHEQVVTLTRDDLFETVFPAPRRDRGYAFTIPMFRANVVEAAAGAVGVTLDPSRGHVISLVSQRGTNQSESVPGTAFACDVEGEGPFYVNDNNLPDGDRTGTSDVGAAAFFNVPVGEARVTVSNEDRTCVLHGPGFEDPDHDDVAVLPVRAGTLSHANFRCPD